MIIYKMMGHKELIRLLKKETDEYVLQQNTKGVEKNQKLIEALKKSNKIIENHKKLEKLLQQENN